MPSLQIEQTLRFDFPHDWQAIKYDDTAFHLNYLNPIQEIKAVDIAAVPQSPGHLLFIEVKDYRMKAETGGRCGSYDYLARAVARKALSTVAGLYLSSRIGDVALAPFAGRLLKAPQKLEVVLFMQELSLPPSRHYNYQKILLDVRQKLIGLLDNLGITARLYSLGALPPPGPWTVTDLYTPPAIPLAAIPSPKKK
ncbi:MAG: hypothetical protein ACRYFX_15865 [Janthinobacterium lividum]